MFDHLGLPANRTVGMFTPALRHDIVQRCHKESALRQRQALAGAVAIACLRRAAEKLDGEVAEACRGAANDLQAATV